MSKFYSWTSDYLLDLPFAIFYKHYELCLWEMKQEENRFKVGAAFIVYNLAGMLGCKDVKYEDIAQGIGMFIENPNNITSKVVEKDKEKAINTMDLFLNKDW